VDAETLAEHTKYFTRQCPAPSGSDESTANELINRRNRTEYMTPIITMQQIIHTEINPSWPILNLLLSLSRKPKIGYLCPYTPPHQNAIIPIEETKCTWKMAANGDPTQLQSYGVAGGSVTYPFAIIPPDGWVHDNGNPSPFPAAAAFANPSLASIVFRTAQL